MRCGEEHPAGHLLQLPPARGPVILRPGRKACHGAGVQLCAVLLHVPLAAHQRPALRIPPGPRAPPRPQQLERALCRQPVEDGTLGRSMFTMSPLRAFSIVGNSDFTLFVCISTFCLQSYKVLSSLVKLLFSVKLQNCVKCSLIDSTTSDDSEYYITLGDQDKNKTVLSWQWRKFSWRR